MHSADRVLPEYQNAQVGDTIELGSNRMRLELAQPKNALAWRSEDGNWIWTFVLVDRGGTTRLIQPKPLPSGFADGAYRHAADGTRVPGDGAAHVARNQAAVRRSRARGGAWWNAAEPELR